mmetsp:Transcript_2990/g.8444  ORF Transcript_2990/g.8444 Transcript_2990/m.8444 type:complete len:182 (+) Transcript_2990:158-703(+)
MEEEEHAGVEDVVAARPVEEEGHGDHGLPPYHEDEEDHEGEGGGIRVEESEDSLGKGPPPRLQAVHLEEGHSVAEHVLHGEGETEDNDTHGAESEDAHLAVAAHTEAAGDGHREEPLGLEHEATEAHGSRLHHFRPSSPWKGFRRAGPAEPDESEQQGKPHILKLPLLSGDVLPSLPRKES